MNAHPNATAAASSLISTPDAARTFANRLISIMNALLKIVEDETDLVRSGNVRDAILLESEKAELSRRYLAAIALLKANQRYLTQAVPELLTTLHRHHDVFRAMLQVNLTVLATAHAVSEGIIRGVNGEMQRRNAPQTYNASGYRSSAGARNAAPLSVSRSL